MTIPTDDADECDVDNDLEGWCWTHDQDVANCGDPSSQPVERP